MKENLTKEIFFRVTNDEKFFIKQKYKRNKINFKSMNSFLINEILKKDIYKINFDELDFLREKYKETFYNLNIIAKKLNADNDFLEKLFYKVSDEISELKKEIVKIKSKLKRINKKIKIKNYKINSFQKRNLPMKIRMKKDIFEIILNKKNKTNSNNYSEFILENILNNKMISINKKQLHDFRVFISRGFNNLNQIKNRILIIDFLFHKELFEEFLLKINSTISSLNKIYTFSIELNSLIEKIVLKKYGYNYKSKGENYYGLL